MIEENALVVAVDTGYAWVETRRKSSCGTCAANKGCGTGALSQVFGTKGSRMRVLNEVAARVGEEVVIGIEESALVRGSLAVYALPLVMLMAGGLFGVFMAPQLGVGKEPASMLGALVGVVAGFGWLARYTRRISSDRRFQPVIIRRLPGTPLQRIDSIG